MKRSKSNVNQFRRLDRVADRIKRELAVLIQQKSEDPRFFKVTLIDIDLSPDLSYAKVFFTILGDVDKKALTDALNSASGFFRHLLAKRVNIRRVPQLHFVYDESIEQGQRLSALIDSAIESDEKLHSKGGKHAN